MASRVRKGTDMGHRIHRETFVAAVDQYAPNRGIAYKNLSSYSCVYGTQTTR